MKTISISRGYTVLVDDEDFDRVNAFKWQALVRPWTVYAHRTAWVDGVRTTISMHRFILGCAEDVDHRDCDGLNNQKSNLRPATTPQNHANRRKQPGTSSVFKGVCLTAAGTWQASIKENGRLRHLGCFRDECDAAQAYNFVADELYGEFARLNTPAMLDVLGEAGKR